MNLELNVVRFENEDVIATSDFCSIGRIGRENPHVKVIGELDSGEYQCIVFMPKYSDVMDEDDFQTRIYDGPWEQYEQNMTATSIFEETPNVGSYYYWKNDHRFAECPGEHNPDVAKVRN